jgi:hypothetical protein
MTDADFARKQEMLRQAMRVDMPNRAPMCCCEGVETSHEVKPSRIGWMIWPALLVGLGVVAGIWGYARAATPADHMRPHEIVLLLPPDKDRPGIITISAAYPDRLACEKAKQRVTVKAPGAKLVCGIVNPWRVK